MKRVDKLAITAAVLAMAAIAILINAWSIPQERVERNRTCEWRMTAGGTEVCR